MLGETQETGYTIRNEYLLVLPITDYRSPITTL